MKDEWKHHVKHYDLFQMNRDSYVAILNFFVKQFKRYKNILDSGAGSGNLTLKLLVGGNKVTAIDSNKKSIEVLKEKCKRFKNKLKAKVMDVQTLDFKPESFDAVASMFVVPFVKDNKRYFFEVYRVLKDKGKFVISSWAPMKDTWKGIMTEQEKELTRKGILPKYNKSWEYIQKSSKVAIKDVLKALNLKQIKYLLKEIGFRNIKEIKSLYGKYAYLIVCEK